jgi:uncharacterized membrane protein YoaK (UPF0700 family)
MICKVCGTEIADKAIVCFRCGNATFEAQRRPAALPSRGRSLIVTLALLVVLFAALFLGQAGTGQVPQVVSWAVAAMAAIVVAWRLVVRRR